MVRDYESNTMAANRRVLKDVEEQLTCPICLSLFEHAKVLRCHHVFCRDCLRKCIVTDGERRSFVRCSACRQGTRLPEGGVDKIEAAFTVNKLFDTRDKLLETVKAEEANKGTSTGEEMCKLHPDRPRELWCETCETLICFQCSLKGEKHCSHHFYLASKLVDQMKQEMTASCNTLTQHQSRFEATLKELDNHMENLYATEKTTKLEIQKMADALREAITCTEVSAVKDLYSKVEEQAARLSPFRDKLGAMISTFQSCVEELQTSIEISEPCKLMEVKNRLCKEASRLSSKNQENAFLTLDESNQVDFFSDFEVIMQVLKDNFFVYVPDVRNSDIQISGRGLSSATVGEPASFKVEASICLAHHWTKMLQGLECRLYSNITNEEVSLAMSKESNASYLFSYIPSFKGNHSVEINYKGKPVSHSPYQVAVTSKREFEFIFPLHSRNIPVVPTDMIVSKGKIVISSLSSFGVLNQKPEFHPYPGANISKLIESDRDTFFAVVCSISGIVEFGTNGNKIRNVATLGCDIADIACSKTSKLLLVLLPAPSFGYHSNHVIVYCLDKNVSYKSSFGRNGQGKGKLDSPVAITVHDQSSTVFIADTNKNRIEVFDCQGKYLNRISPRRLAKPTYLAISKTHLFVSDVAKCIFIFELNGSHLHTFQMASDIGNLVSLAVDNCNVLYLCDDKNKRVILQ